MLAERDFQHYTFFVGREQLVLQRMDKRKNIFSLGHKISSIIMLLALAWLTVSLPFVYEDQLQRNDISVSYPVESPEDDSNPLAGTTEEKTPNGFNSLSEYLHDIHLMAHHSTIIVKYYKCHPTGLHYAFHPELISPPPEASLS
jgi:hypothetical protein